VKKLSGLTFTLVVTPIRLSFAVRIVRHIYRAHLEHLKDSLLRGNRYILDKGTSFKDPVYIAAVLVYNELIIKIALVFSVRLFRTVVSKGVPYLSRTLACRLHNILNSRRHIVVLLNLYSYSYIDRHRNVVDG